ncbi:FAD-binding protein [Paenibacillus sp. F411]|uniref:UDP-N-acetylmuramate dehydrogenase n=1 Tax=Paenibacillus sp. F411 TaxID=2820239 RepID=UPI001AAFF797|nr:FAD-binding protein [Paenibacillus sp. F411]MBO2944252.1 FAD-binding protein [Paenibacillus sp. F411]
MNLQSSVIEQLCRRQTPLAPYSTYAIGGEAGFLAEPETTEELITLYKAAFASGLPWYSFGMGSNLLFPDAPDPDLLFISLKRHCEIREQDGKWYVSAGTPMSLLSLIGLRGGDSRMELSFLLPGCLGAGIYMNAKYNQLQISELLDTVYYVDTSTEGLSVQSIHASACGFGYKQSIFQQKPWIIVGAKLNVDIAAEEQLLYASQLVHSWKTRGCHSSSLPQWFSYILGEVHALAGIGIPTPPAMLDIIKYRTSRHHFDAPSCGSVFKNNYDYGVAVGSLVEQLQLKGLSRGGAVISPYHGNMILNQNHASAADILYLMDVISEGIERKFGFLPEPEIVIV